MTSNLVIAMSDGEPLFFEDLRALVSDESKPLRDAALASVEAALSTTSAEKRQHLAETISQTAAVPTMEGARALRSLGFLSRAAGSAEGQADAQGFLEALQTMARDGDYPPLTESETEQLRELFLALAQRGEAIRRSLSELRAKQGVLPMFEEIQGTVEMRAVRKLVVGGSPGDLAGVVPIVSVRVKCDVGQPNSFYFQLTEEGLDDLIDNLQHLRDELRALKDYVRVS